MRYCNGSVRKKLAACAESLFRSIRHKNWLHGGSCQDGGDRVARLGVFFFQAEDGIRDWSVTGVQTCALPISSWPRAAFAGVIKSGGKTRRAAKMVILNVEHPDIVDFINCKVDEERKAWALIDAGYDGSFTGPAYSSVFFQNSNNSVRVPDDFMRAVLDDGEWDTKAIMTGDVMDTYKARDLMRLIAEGTHVCGDPGMQFDTTVNEWHTCP